MKTVGSLLGLIGSGRRRENIRIVLWMLVALAAMIAVYSLLFHQLMAGEGRVYSWATSFYWTITTMSTLGFGDITFQSDAGRIFSVFVLVSGAIFLLILFPFSIIEFFFAPWMDRREARRAPQRAPTDLVGHILATRLDPVTQALIARAKRSEVPHLVIVESPAEATRAFESGYQAIVGSLDSPGTYGNAGIERAAIVVSTQPDTTNTNVAFTVREIHKEIPIVVTADKQASVDVLELAGADHVIQLASTLGTALARRVLSTTGRSHIVGQLGTTRIAEAAARGTPLVGQTVEEAGLQDCGPKLLAISERGRIELPQPQTVIGAQSILILAGTDEDLAAYDVSYGRTRPTEDSPVLVLGGGRVGRAAADVLAASGLTSCVVEQSPDVAQHARHVVVGDAAEIEVLREAGLETASDVLVTTHEDDVNVYLTLYCRRLKPDLQIVARATHERNVSTLYRAGADGVLSYAALGATAIWNTLGRRERVVVAEGVELFQVPVPRLLAKQNLTEASEVIRHTKCHVVAVTDEAGNVVRDANHIPSDTASGLLILGDRHGERLFRETFKTPGRDSAGS